jgi:hypothetical protein
MSILLGGGRVLSSRKFGAHGLEHSTGGGQDAEEREIPAIDDNGAVNQDLELPVVTMDHVHVGAQLTANPRRRPDGVQPGDSIRAVPYRDP